MARQLLGESRYAEDLPEIIFSAVDRDGEPSVSVQFMLDAWQEELGVEVRADLVAPEVYYYELESVSEHLYTYGWVADYPDPENFLDLLLHSEAHDSRYANPLYDNLFGTGAGGTGPREQAQLVPRGGAVADGRRRHHPALPRQGLRDGAPARARFRDIAVRSAGCEQGLPC